MPYNYEILHEIKNDAHIVWDLEADNKNLLKQHSYTPKIKFDGSICECFSDIRLLRTKY